MPTVRRYEGRQVGLAALPGVRKQAAETPESQGYSLAVAEGQKWQTIGSVANRVGTQALSFVQEIVQRADDTALLEADNTLSRWEQWRLYNTETGALNVTGKNALPLPEEVDTEFEQMADQVSVTLNDRQRARFNQRRAQRGISLSMTMRRHTAEQMQAYEQNEMKQGVANLTNEAVAAALDPPMVDQKLGELRALITKHGATIGMGPEAREAALAESLSGVHVGVINRLITAKKPLDAQKYYDHWKSEVKGTAREGVEQALVVGTIRTESQKIADQIIAEGGTETEQLEKAHKQVSTDNSELRDAVDQRIEHNASVVARKKREAEEEASVLGYDIVDKTGDTTQIPAAVWASYSGGTRASLKSYAKIRAAGNEPETDWNLYYARKDEAGKTQKSREVFRDRDLMLDRPRLSDAEFKDLTSLQLAIRNNDHTQSDERLADHRSETELINTAFDAWGVNPQTNKDKQWDAAIAFVRQTVGEAAQAYRSRTGKKPDNTELQRMVNEAMKQPFTIKGTTWHPWNALPFGAPLWEVDVKKSLLDIRVSDIPKTMIAELDATLRKYGYPVNDTARLTLFMRMNRVVPTGPPEAP